MPSGSELFDKIEELRTQADNMERHFLAESGWKWVCNTPSSLWMWEKKLPDGRTVLANQEVALLIQEELDIA
jgi:hypothetical protein